MARVWSELVVMERSNKCGLLQIEGNLLKRKLIGYNRTVNTRGIQRDDIYALSSSSAFGYMERIKIDDGHSDTRQSLCELNGDKHT